MSMTSAERHLDDNELLGLTDGDGGGWQLDQWSKHVLVCPVCSERLTRMQRRASRVSEILEEIQLPEGFPVEPPAVDEVANRGRRRSVTPPSSTRWLRAAAVILILMVPLVTIEPLRAAAQEWLSDRWSDLVSLFDGAGGGAEPLTEAGVDPTGGSTLLFVPVSEVFVLDVGAPQRSGSVRIRSVRGPEGSFEVLGTSTTTPLVVPAGIRLLNEATATSSYELAVPSSIRTLRIEVGGRTVASIETAALAGPIEVPLGPN